ncbi:carboxymuconolactone decarboxylase family protein [Herbaspirillum huttiense]|uniref:carboxymuconolactone decarboxylase family protein n=1 Tax=Herbaspirillum huttiense TaxID=863372 RepID=UPI002E762EFB|nr:carboxymuconolactone decarboxylase family protein [Herbaspirillum huttiense]MEE1637122.1 carboxymuconolactone decarboxylase family protein [Herbaspirillum huttiense NC40101]
MQHDTSQPRLPAVDVSTATPAQKEVLDDILKGPRGNLAGPFLSWIHSPELAQHAQKLGAFCRYHTQLPLSLSELAILCTAARWQAQAEWQIHYPIGIEAGLDVANVERIRRGERPDFAARDEQMIWELVEELYETKRISDPLYREAEQRFGIEVLVNFVGLLGYYSLVAMTLNVFHVRHGDGALPFAEQTGQAAR